MTLQAAGIISFGDIIKEFGGISPEHISNYYASGDPSSLVKLNNTKIPKSGTIKWSDFYGAQTGFYTVLNLGTSHNFNLANAARAAGWNGIQPLFAIINLNGIIGSTSTSTPAFSDAGSFPTGSYYT